MSAFRPAKCRYRPDLAGDGRTLAIVGGIAVKSLGPIILYLLLALGGGGFAWLAGSGGAEWQGWPVMAVCASLAFAINWAAAVPAILAKTEHFYDLTGSLTYLAVVAAALALTGRSATPGLFEVMRVLGKERTLVRLRAGADLAQAAGMAS